MSRSDVPRQSQRNSGCNLSKITIIGNLDQMFQDNAMTYHHGDVETEWIPQTILPRTPPSPVFPIARRSSLPPCPPPLHLLSLTLFLFPAMSDNHTRLPPASSTTPICVLLPPGGGPTAAPWIAPGWSHCCHHTQCSLLQVDWSFFIFLLAVLFFIPHLVFF